MEKNLKILTIANKKEEKFLRQKTSDFDFKKFSKKEVRELADGMRKEMLKAKGIGLSANQVGNDFKMFVAGLPIESGGMKFFYVFNPKLDKASREKSTMEEGCLSVPDVFGEVERPEKVIISGQDKNGRKIKIEAKGFLARIFQHEIDHLNGVLFIDKAEKLFKRNENEIGALSSGGRVKI